MRKLMCLTILLASVSAAQAAEVKTVLAAGCFWSMQKALDHAPGVTHTQVGYAGGDIQNPTYENYHDGAKPHAEAVEVTYDDSKTSYAQLLDYYFHHIDPTEARGQFCDYGPGYRPVIFTATPEQKAQANTTRADIARQLGQPVAVAIEDAGTFWPAEGYHQDYYKTNPETYDHYRIRCGRDAKLQAVWSGGNK